MSSYSLSQLARALRLPGWLFTSALVGVLAARRLVTEGLFGDGLCYAAIARNMTMGQGNFWSPFYSTSFWLTQNHNTAAFYEHPPLMFGIESVFFNFLGDTIWTEKIYSTVVLLLTTFVLVQLWKRLLPADHPLRLWSWLPVAVWFSFHLVNWGMTQNLLDTTMSLFCLISVGFVLTGLQQPDVGRAWLSGGLAVVALLAAFLTKGPVSLHVLGIPVLYGLFYSQTRSYARMIGWTAGLTLGFAFLLGTLLLYEPARHNLSMYVDQQLVAALNSQREITTEAAGRFFLLQTLLINVWVVVLLSAAIYALRRVSKTVSAGIESLSRTSIFWTVVGLSVVVPMSISRKQYEHYLLPALPYIGLGLASWLGENLLMLLAHFTRWYAYRWALIVTGSLLFAGMLAFVWRSAGTMFYWDRSFLIDLHTVGRIVPNQDRLGVLPSMMRNFPLHPYLQRYYRIDMTPLEKQPAYAMMYMMTTPARLHNQVDSMSARGYVPVQAPLHQFALYKRQSQQP